MHQLDGLEPVQFESAIRREASARKEPCILDLDARNARDFEQGRPELVFRDLNVGVLPEVRRAPSLWSGLAPPLLSRMHMSNIRRFSPSQTVSQRVLALFHEHGVYQAFELRAELISFKKALYHLYLEAMAVRGGHMAHKHASSTCRPRMNVQMHTSTVRKGTVLEFRERCGVQWRCSM